MALNVGALQLPTLVKGSTGAYVVAWQRFLKETEYLIGWVTGSFDNTTEAATRSYQIRNNLIVNGVLDEPTYAKALPQGLMFKVPNFSAQMLLNYLGFDEAEVKDLQQALNTVAQLIPPLNVDGNFGSTSTKALAEAYLQRDVRLREGLEVHLSAATQKKLGADFHQAVDVITSYAKRLRFILSGPHWYNYFPTSRAISDLVSPFREQVQSFYKAMLDAGAQIVISATYRPAARAYLMHYASAIYNGDIDPEDVPPMDGVTIDWVHYTHAGSLLGASLMLDAYGIGGNPVSLNSLHIQRLAIDWNITWQGTIKIKDANGNIVELGEPRNGVQNQDLFEVGASYGVYKLQDIDPPHWSYNGH